jgi:hypothetical protein
MRWAGHVARMKEKRNVFRFLGGKTDGNRLLERPRRKWKYSIKRNLVEIGIKCTDRNHLVRDGDLPTVQ